MILLRSALPTTRRLLATSASSLRKPGAMTTSNRRSSARFAGVADGASSSSALDDCRRLFHSSRPAPNNNTNNNIHRLGLGSTKWNRLGNNPQQQYVEIVGTALQNGIHVLEAGPEGGDQALCDAILQYTTSNTKQALEDSSPLEILVRVGYRLHHHVAEEKVDGTLVHKKQNNMNDDDELGGVPPDTVAELELKKLVFESDVVQEAGGGSEEYAVHNISPDYLEHAIENSPVLKLKEQLGISAADKMIQFTVLLHNPEVQQTSDLYYKLAKAFSKLEEMDQVDSYGVSSNGLCLPTDHPLHLDYNTVLNAAARVTAKNINNTKKFRVVQLPVNALETAGVDIARKIHKRASNDDSNNNIEIYGMRPLTCYPDQGTGTGRPFLLTDYQIPATMEKKLAWTHEMEHAPQAYDVALKTALQHFDADELLEKKAQNDDDLTPEERETLDGCKLMQSVLHDLDVALPEIRSFAAHEDTLYRQVIPVIQDTFESYDENTAQVLQTFFGAYSLAVRYHVAKNTRHLLRHGESSSSSNTTAVTYSEEDLPASKRLQEFALEYVLKQKVVDGGGGGGSSTNKPAIDKIIVGCSQPIQVVSSVNIVKDFQDDA